MKTLIALLLVCLCAEAYGHGGLGYSPFRGYNLYGSPFRGYNRYGGFRRYGGYANRPAVFTPDTRSLSGPASEIFTATGTVPEKLERVPDQLLQIQFGPLSIAPNMTVLISQLQRRPRLFWEAEPNTLYTVMIEDVDVLDVVGGGNTGKHWLVTNIPGTNVAAGDEVGDYLQSFFFANAEGGLDFEGTRDQRHIIMVYKQTRRIESDELEKFSGCGPPAVRLGARLGPNHQSFFPGLGLEGPVAANFYRLGYQQGWSEFFVCYIKKCYGLSLIPPSKIPEQSPQKESLQCLLE